MGWPTAGYERAGHPVQERILEEVVRWTGVPRESLVQGVDGCTTVCFGLPLRAMALAYARLGVSEEPAAARVRGAMLAHPQLVGGLRRLCTDLMRESGGRVLAKVGAEGVYSAAWPERRLGIALKVSDGENRSAQVALLGVLRQLRDTLGGGPGARRPRALRGATDSKHPAGADWLASCRRCLAISRSQAARIPCRAGLNRNTPGDDEPFARPADPRARAPRRGGGRR